MESAAAGADGFLRQMEKDRKDRRAGQGGPESPSSAALDDKALLKACWSREKGAWEKFLDCYSKLIYFAIHQTLNLKHYRASPEEIEDLFSDLLVHIIKDDCRKLRLFRGDEGCSVATWLRTITVRFTLDYLRQRARDGVMVQVDGEEVSLEVSLSNPVVQPDQVYEEREEDRRLLAAIERLSENDRIFMELFYTKGLKPEQVGDFLGISVKTVYSRISRLKAKLNEDVQRSGRKR